MAFTREAFSLGNLFDQDHFGSTLANEKGQHPLMCDDTEFSMRVRRNTGKRIFYNPQVKIQHRVYSYRLTRKFIRRYAYRHAYSKAVMKQLYHNGRGEYTLTREHELLKRILIRLLPSIFVGFFSKPRHAWKRLAVTSTVLFYTAMGYIAGSLSSKKALEPRLI